MMSSLSHSPRVCLLGNFQEIGVRPSSELGDGTQRLDYLGQVFNGSEPGPSPDLTLLPYPARSLSHKNGAP